MNTSNRPALRRTLAAACVAASLGLWGMNAAVAAGACGKHPCVSALSVVSAAGDEFRTALAKVEFAGDALAPQSREAVATLARKWSSAKEPLKLRVAADANLQGAAAQRQAAARAAALKQALVDAGLPAAKVSITS
ncbi:MAG TPA: hypothetical protein VFL64_22195 [Rhizobacter sp.]|nr:hypothetical protein [Rhizobacter sp.]